MEAAFVEIGLEKNGFLYVDEIVVPELEGKRHGKKITDLIQRGQHILVQAVKDPMKTKGARLTTEISLPGRFLVYVPNGEGLGVSRRLEDSERQRLKDILKDIMPAKGGVIVRTAAEGASAEDVERDLVFLQRLWKTIEARAKTASAPELVYQEAELPLRIVRDLFAGDFAAAHVDSDRAHKRIVGYLKKTSPHMVDRVHRTKEKEPLFERYGVEKEIASTLDRRVDLPSGGYLIFDYAEAFTVIDVNTGRFVGSRSKTSTQRLEDTATKNNLEAVKEVVRQLRLRDIGGIIVIDFIDMANPKNRQAVEDAFRTELERDRTKTYVVEISPLGLVEMTRQNVTDGPREIMTRSCPTCGGDGIVVSDATNALQVERRLRALAVAGAGSRVQAYRVALHPRTLALVAGPGGARLAALEDATRRRFYLVPAEGHIHSDHFEVLAEGRRDDLAASAPVEEGAEVELKLVELDLHDVGAAVGKLDGLDVVVADTAKLVGKKVKVVVGRVLDGVRRSRRSSTPARHRRRSRSRARRRSRPARRPSRRKSGEAAPEPAEAPSDELEPVADVVVVEEPVPGVRCRGRRDRARGRERPRGSGPEADEARLTRRQAPEEAGSRCRRAGRDRGRQRPRMSIPRPRRRSTRRSRRSRSSARSPGRSRRSAASAHRRSTCPDTDGAPAAQEPPGTDGEAVVEPVVSDDMPEAEVEAEASATDGDATDGDAPAAKKRTRRGTRGGRNRKRKPAAANGDASGRRRGDSAEAAATEPNALEEAPVPEPEDAPQQVAEPVDATAPAEAGYVPMSEWIEDFDRR